MRSSARERLADELAAGRIVVDERERPILPTAGILAGIRRRAAGGRDSAGGTGAADGRGSAAGSAAAGGPSTRGAGGVAPALATAGTATAAAADGGWAPAMPTWSTRASLADIGLVGWIRTRLAERPARADRSRTLLGEGGGRLDRLDAWILVVLLLATLGMRTFRLEEPYQMHFDEVYHARTATEFLQAWRYGDSHDIYEWTHPHLAKYAMAAGLVLWGEDHVSGTGDLGTPVAAAAIEPRREDPLTGERAGERLHLATGAGIQTDDLRTRQTVSTFAAPGSSALAIDESAEQLLIGFDDGRLATVDLAIIGLDGVDSGVEPVPLATVDHPVTHLLATEDGLTIIAASDDRLSVVDTATGDVTGTLDLPGIADLAPAGSGPALVATPD